MKKKLICGMVIGTLVFSSAALTGCGSSKEVSNNTQTSQNQNTSNGTDNPALNSNTENNSDNAPKRIENSKTTDSNKDEDNAKDSSKSDNKSESSNSSKNEIENHNNINKGNTESSNPTSDSTDSKNASSKDSSNTDKSNKNDSSDVSTKDDSDKKETTSLTMQQLADKIADFEYDGNVKYITPVNPIGSGKDLTYKEDPSSNIFFCSDDKFDSKNLKYGTLVNLFGYNKESDSYSFRVTNYESLKNGGTGTIDYGTVTSQGNINSANAN